MADTASGAGGAGDAADPHGHTAQVTRSKAGRNLPVAIGVGVGLILLVIVTLFTVKWLFAFVAVAAICIGIDELTGAFAHVGIRIARTPLYLGTVVLAFCSYVWGIEALLMVFGAIVITIMMWRIRRGTHEYVRDTTASVFVAAYLPFMLGFLMLTLATSNGPQRVAVFVVLTISSDIGGYATGVLFGKHPIAPKISPKKSWEGFAGSVFFQVVIGAVLFVWLLDAPWWQGAITGAVMTITATAGDFTESAIKRDLGVKDMSQLLPGHGGLMDRLDSLVPNAFVSWALFQVFLG